MQSAENGTHATHVF